MKFVTDILKNFSNSKKRVRKIMVSSPLHEAAQTGDIAKLTELLDGGSDIELLDEKGEPPIFHAIRGGHMEAVRFLLSHGANVNVRSRNLRSFSERTPLHETAMQVDVPMMLMLLESGAELEARDSTGQTPLAYAVWSEREIRGEVPTGTHLGAVKFLVASGADVNGADNHGGTPLCFAKIQRANEIADFLLEAGVTPVNDPLPYHC
jgi:ankyrin repeat protein